MMIMYKFKLIVIKLQSDKHTWANWLDILCRSHQGCIIMMMQLSFMHFSLISNHTILI